MQNQATYYTKLSVKNYYPFGMTMPGRSFNSPDYRFGFNTQERSDELHPDHYTAEYWEYDSRLGRRWNQDPVNFIGITPYSINFNNPIWFSDISGDSAVTTPSGNVINAGEGYGTTYNGYMLEGDGLAPLIWNPNGGMDGNGAYNPYTGNNTDNAKYAAVKASYQMAFDKWGQEAAESLGLKSYSALKALYKAEADASQAEYDGRHLMLFGTYLEMISTVIAPGEGIPTKGPKKFGWKTSKSGKNKIWDEIPVTRGQKIEDDFALGLYSKTKGFTQTPKNFKTVDFIGDNMVISLKTTNARSINYTNNIKQLAAMKSAGNLDDAVLHIVMPAGHNPKGLKFVKELTNELGVTLKITNL